MTPEKVRSMVAAMQAAGEDDAAIKAALDLAKSQQPRDPRDVANEAKLKAMGGPGSKEYPTPLKPFAPGEDPPEPAASPVSRGLDALGSAFTDTFALGAPGKLLDLLPNRPVLGMDHPPAHYIGGTREERQARRAASPVGDIAGQTMGMGLDAVGGVGSAVGRGVEASIPAARGAAGALARSTASGGIQGGATGAATPEDMSLRERGLAALRGTVFGAGLGGALGAGGQAAGAVAKAVQGSQGGRARQLIESRGGEVGPTTSGRGGVFDKELAGLAPNDRGIGEAGRRAAGSVLDDVEKRFFSETAMPHHAAREAIADSVEGEVVRDITPIYDHLAALYKSQRLTPSERSLVNGVLTSMDETVAQRGSPMLTEVELNDFRGMLGDLSGRGSPGEPTVAQSKLDKVTGATKEMVDEGPYAETNKRFAEGRSKLERQRNILDLPDHPSTSLDPRRSAPEGGREPEVAKVANFLARDQQNTVTAGVRNADRVGRFTEENPEYASTLELPEVMRAKADLEFTPGAKGHGGLVGRLTPGIGLGAAAALAIGGQREMAAGALLPVAAEFAGRNWPAISGRLLYDPAMGAQTMRQMPQALPGFIPEIEQAYAEHLARRKK